MRRNHQGLRNTRELGQYTIMSSRLSFRLQSRSQTQRGASDKQLWGGAEIWGAVLDWWLLFPIATQQQRAVMQTRVTYLLDTGDKYALLHCGIVTGISGCGSGLSLPNAIRTPRVSYREQYLSSNPVNA